jgi:hypothetical protein
MVVMNGMKDLKKEKYWQEIIEQQKESGKSQTQFCKDEGLTDSTFCYWKGVLAKRQKGINQAKPSLENKVALPFVTLKVPDSVDFNGKRDPAEQIEISKIVLRISASTDNSTLTCILQSLEKA